MLISQTACIILVVFLFNSLRKYTMFKMYVSINEFPLLGSVMQFDSSDVSDSRHCEENDFQSVLQVSDSSE